MMNIGKAASFTLWKIKRALKSESGAVDIVAIVVLIGIAVALAVVFKDQINTLLKSLFQKISTDATNATTIPG